jgi:hypothetical protein
MMVGATFMAAFFMAELQRWLEAGICTVGIALANRVHFAGKRSS